MTFSDLGPEPDPVASDQVACLGSSLASFRSPGSDSPPVSLDSKTTLVCRVKSTGFGTNSVVTDDAAGADPSKGAFRAAFFLFRDDFFFLVAGSVVGMGRDRGGTAGEVEGLDGRGSSLEDSVWPGGTIVDDCFVSVVTGTTAMVPKRT